MHGQPHIRFVLFCFIFAEFQGDLLGWRCFMFFFLNFIFPQECWDSAFEQFTDTYFDAPYNAQSINNLSSCTSSISNAILKQMISTRKKKKKYKFRVFRWKTKWFKTVIMEKSSFSDIVTPFRWIPMLFSKLLPSSRTLIYSILKTNVMHYFSSLFAKELYMFRIDLLSIIRSLNTVFI